MCIYTHTYTYMCFCCLVAQSCPTLCILLDCSPPGHSVHGISQARILEWIAIFFSRVCMCIYIYVSFWSNTKFVNMYCVLGYTDLFLMSNIYIKV